MRAFLLAALVCLTTSGCGRSSGPPNAQSVPVKGVVALDGKPLAGADVVFMTSGMPPIVLAATTKEDGGYQLQSVRPGGGELAGSYKVTISRMVKPDGSALGPDETPANVGAIEQLPAKYSSFEQTVLTQAVSAEGGSFDFPLESK